MKQGELALAESTVSAPLTLTDEIRSGDEHAYANLVREVMPVVYRFLLRMLASREDAEDLTQETFYEIYRRRDTLKPGKDITPYLFTIARRKAISRFRWRTVRRVLTPLNDVHEDTVPGAHECPREQLDEHTREACVMKALQGLKEDKRTVVILRFFEEYSYADISEVMGKPEGTVKSLAFRAERELRERLESLMRLPESEKQK